MKSDGIHISKRFRKKHTNLMIMCKNQLRYIQWNLQNSDELILNQLKTMIIHWKYVETYDHLVKPEGVCHVYWCTTGGTKSLEISLKISQGSVSCDLLIESMGMHIVHEGIIINL